MNWKKRTAAEIDEAVNKGDYTGGYEFWPWLLWMRPMYCVSFLLVTLIGWCGGLGAIIKGDANGPEWISYAVIGFFGVFAPILIGYKLRQDYKLGKQGKSE